MKLDIKHFIEDMLKGSQQTKQGRSIIIKQGGVAVIHGIPSEPATSEPRYICQNCGMLIKTGHKHTREECQEYQENSINPDLRAHRVILPSRNDPKIRLPYYYEERST